MGEGGRVEVQRETSVLRGLPAERANEKQESCSLNSFQAFVRVWDSFKGEGGGTAD